jgi:ABC-2 type transport system ATP-binding protein
MSLAVETWSLSKNFGGARVLHEISLAVPRGSVFALLGPNGSGKSTLLKLLIGLQSPSAGGGLCLGLDILTRAEEIREKAGYLSEEPRFYGYMTVRQLLRFTGGFYLRWDRELVERCLEQFALPPRAKVHELSQGMKNQLGLILALAPRPELLILDEPTTGFDPIKRRLFFSIIMQEVAARGVTVLMTSHHLDEVERSADHVALLRGGRLIHTGPMDALRGGTKEIRAVFQKDPPPELFEQPGVSRVEREGKGRAYRIFVTANLEEIWQACASQPHYALESIGPDLEEIFMRFIGEVKAND